MYVACEVGGRAWYREVRKGQHAAATSVMVWVLWAFSFHPTTLSAAPESAESGIIVGKLQIGV